MQCLQESIYMWLVWGFEAAIYNDAYYDTLHQDDYKIQYDILDSIPFISNAKGDTMNYHKAMGAPDKPKKKTNDKLIPQ